MRAAWLYHVAGNTQHEIARKLQISRPTAQRLLAFQIARSRKRKLVSVDKANVLENGSIPGFPKLRRVVYRQ